MTDRELLELAAKAAGWLNTEFQDMRGWGEVRFGLSEALWVPELDCYWNPLTDDGDALRLAVKIGIHVSARTVEVWHFGEMIGHIYEDDGDAESATRRAIVRAAAEIGKAMQQEQGRTP